MTTHSIRHTIVLGICMILLVLWAAATAAASANASPQAAQASQPSEIEVESAAFGTFKADSFGWGFSAELPAAPGGGAIRAGSMNISRIMDKASPKLAQACAGGQHIPEVKLIMRKAGGDTGGARATYIKYAMTNVLITSYQTSGSGGDVLPVENISLNFEEIEWTYTEQIAGDNAGSVGLSCPGYDICQGGAR